MGAAKMITVLDYCLQLAWPCEIICMQDPFACGTISMRDPFACGTICMGTHLHVGPPFACGTHLHVGPPFACGTICMLIFARGQLNLELLH